MDRRPSATGRFAASLLWSNSFSWEQDVPGEDPSHRSFLVDGETLTLDATVSRGLRRNLDVALRVPVRWRGGGVMDGMIDAWHSAFGFPDGGRPYFPRDVFQVEGTTTQGGTFSWTDQAGTGLGAVELATRWRFVDAQRGSTFSRARRPRLPAHGERPLPGPRRPGPAPSSSSRRPSPGRSTSTPGSARRRRAAAPWAASSTRHCAGHGFVALEWRPWRGVSLVAETDAASRLVANIERYPGTHWMLNVTGRVDLGRRTRLDLGFTENIKNQLSTTDFALYTALALRP